MNSSDQECLMCHAKTANYFRIFDEMGESMRIAEIIRKHFWFELNENDSRSNEICSECWDKINAFHEFYCRVEILFQQHLINEELDDFPEICYEDQINEMGTNTQNESFTIESDKDRAPLSSPSADHLQGETRGETPELDTFMYHEGSEPDNDESSVDCSVDLTQKVDKILDEKQVKLTNEEEIRQYFNMKCELCPQEFQTLNDAVIHYPKAHSILYGYLKCLSSQCSQQKFGRQWYINEHIDFHENPEKFRCAECGKIFTRQQGLKKHCERVHVPHSVRKFGCNICSRRFFENGALARHVAAIHGAEEDKKFICDICNKRFAIKIALFDHIRYMHISSGSHLCEICAKTFKNKFNLNDHLRTHSTDYTPQVRNYKCHSCYQRFKSKEKLDLHFARVHSQGHHTCKICNEEFQDIKAYKRHVYKIHEEANHKCAICGKAFRTPFILKQHVAAHTGETLFSCPYCAKRFVSSGNMHKHRKRIHPSEWLRDKKVKNTSVSKEETLEI